ncbi:MAG TPA: hypothetical protein VNQ77_13290 [Frankiaceae bacterium]|nr:hypothetical protein [Frankiaceae bacterium]
MTHPAPPRPWLIAYRVLGLRLPPEYRAWAAADTQTKAFLNWRIGRTALWLYAGLGLYYVIQSRMHEPPTSAKLLQAFFIISALALLSSKNTLVRKTLRWQRVDRHGRPVAPKRLAILENREAIVAGTAFVVLLASGMAVYAYGLRPTGIQAIKCRTPNGETMDRIRAGLKTQETKITLARSIPYGDATAIVAYHATGTEKETIAFWIMQGDQLFEVNEAEAIKRSPTKFEPLPRRDDRIVAEAFLRAYTCLTKVRPLKQ